MGPGLCLGAGRPWVLPSNCGLRDAAILEREQKAERPPKRVRSKRCTPVMLCNSDSAKANRRIAYFIANTSGAATVTPTL